MTGATVTVRRRLAAQWTRCAGTRQEDGGRVRWSIWVTGQTLLKVARVCFHACASPLRYCCGECARAIFIIQLPKSDSFLMSLKS